MRASRSVVKPLADEESVAGESPVGDGIVGVLEDKYAYGLGSVARGRSDL